MIASVVLSLCLSLAPTSWLVPWTADIGAIISLPLAPLEHAATRARFWLRPSMEQEDLSSLQVEQLIEERDRYRGMLYQQRLKIRELQSQVQELQAAAQFGSSNSSRLLIAGVSGRRASGVTGPLRLNIGSRQGVLPSSVAVHRGDHLVGLISDDVQRLSSLLIPITDPSNGLIEGFLVPPGTADSRSQFMRVQLAPSGGGMLHADLDARLEVPLNTEVRIDDPGLPAGAQGMRIGRVVDVSRRDEQPLRNRLIIQPWFNAHELASVTIKIDAQQDEGGHP
ncbi:MAG: hypothetical protein CMJ32_01130 [Phycisphaerae bacterium]|nr:hypothetical protein [Phycisphaerae bacterium]